MNHAIAKSMRFYSIPIFQTGKNRFSAFSKYKMTNRLLIRYSTHDFQCCIQ